MTSNGPPLDELILSASFARLLPDARSADVETRRTAFSALSNLGREVGERIAITIPTLLDGLSDPDVQIGESAIYALSNCRPASLKPLIACLARSEPLVRERAAHALGIIGEKARPAAAAALRECLADEVETVRRRASWALGLLRDTDPQTTGALAALIRSGTPFDRAAALHAFGNIAKALRDRSTLHAQQPAILAGLVDSDGEVRRSAKHAFDALGLPAQERAERYMAMLSRESFPPLRTSLRHDLSQLAARADLRAYIPALLAMLSVVAHERCEAVWAATILADMRPVPPELAVVAQLEAAMCAPGLRLAAGRALWRITGRVDGYLAALDEELVEPGEDLCDLVRELGPLGAPLVPRLIAALADESWADLQWAAADALGAVASPVPEVLGALADALNHRSAIVRTAAARALGNMTESLPILVDVLESDDPLAPRTEAAAALAQMGRSARPARRALKALRHTPDLALRDAVDAALKATNGLFQ